VLAWKDVLMIKLSTTITPVSQSSCYLLYSFKSCSSQAMTYMIEHQVFRAEMYIRKETYNNCRERFIHIYSGSPVSTVLCLKFLTSGRTQGQCMMKMTSQELCAHRGQS
jgi:hypothetical protein